MISVLTLVRDRPAHLDRVVRALEDSETPPDELIVVHMNESAARRSSARLCIRAVEMRDAQCALPLAAARNHAVRQSNGDKLIFLDGDCIPAPTLVADYRTALGAAPDALHQGRIRYLPQHVHLPPKATLSAAALTRQSLEHPLQPFLGQDDAYPLFWSLNFACTRATFERIGGFDPDYRGYGAEDTDFSYRARAAGVPLRAAAATAFHQYHPVYDPPLQHVESIVNNARRFHRAWGQWPMQGWLEGFERGGFLAFRDADIVLLRSPSRQEIDACMKTDGNGF